jgi:carbonic anhydrase
MCEQCHPESGRSDRSVARRGFLKLGAAALVASLIGRRAIAADPSAPPPKLQNVMTPDAALERLGKRNERYVEGPMRRHDFIPERSSLVGGQNPYAAILSCADSRIGPEFAFDTGRGDIFVVRVAGNFLTDEGLASFEYAAAVLKTPLLLVLGHQGCGAVGAAIKAVNDGTKFPGHIPSLTHAIAPAVKKAKDQPGDPLENAIKENVLLNVKKLESAGPIISDYVESKRVKVVGGIYDLKSGRVDLIT